MDTIIDYDIVAGGDIGSLVLQVKTKIKRGWQPIGGMSCDEGLYLQAIVKREGLTPKHVIEAQAQLLKEAFR